MDIKRVKKIQVNVGYLVLDNGPNLLRGAVIDRDKNKELFDLLTKNEKLVGEEGSGKRFIAIEFEEEKKEAPPEPKKDEAPKRKTTSGRKRKSTSSE